MRPRTLCLLGLAFGVLFTAGCGGGTASPTVGSPRSSQGSSAAATPSSPTTATPAGERGAAGAVATTAAGRIPPAPAATDSRAAATSTATDTPRAGAKPGQQRVGLDCVVPVIQRHPLDLAPFDPATGRAGDVQFARRVMDNRIYTQFGYVIPAAITSSGQDKSNPQPTYLAPLGTPVHSAVDGVVDRIAELWSTPAYADVSVMVKPDGLPAGCYVVVEAEHVLNPVVAVGDRVSAGQVIAEVGPLNSQGNSGLGLVELGILTGAGNGRPMHVCPYAYFAPAVASAQLAALGRLMADWESYTGNATLWDETSWVGGVIGCSSGPITE